MSPSDDSLASLFCWRPAFSARLASTASRGCRFLVARIQPTVLPNWLATTWAWWAMTVAICTIAGASVQFYEIPYAIPCDNLQFTLPPSGERRLIDEFMVVTEKGTRIPLYEWSASATEVKRYAVASEQQHARDFPTIRLERSSDQTNCHGWVFTQGRYLLFGDGVEQILQDNEYSVAEQPHINDIIIYRNSSGTILHSGIVRAVLDDGTALIESKWGISARYLHLPHNQPYGDNFQYYRSTHTTHHVCIVPRATGLIADLASTVPEGL